jgi:hypothetical protein
MSVHRKQKYNVEKQLQSRSWRKHIYASRVRFVRELPTKIGKLLEPMLK